MSNFLAIRADIKATAAAIDGTGIIHDRPRLAKDWGTYILRFKDRDDRIRGMEITRSSALEHRRGANFRHHRFVLRMVLGFNDTDATEDTFQVTVDNVCEAFREEKQTGTWIYQSPDGSNESPAQVPVIDIRMFGAVLCHYAEIHLSVSERIVVS